MFVVLSGDSCCEPGYGARSPDVPRHEPQSVPRRQRGMMHQVGLGPERARQELVPFQVGEAQTGTRQRERSGCPSDHGSGTEIRRRLAGNTAMLSSSRLCRCRHSQSRKASGAASSWRAASATSCCESAATAAAIRAR